MHPWQYSRTKSLELHTRTPSATTGVRGSAGGPQPAAAKLPLYNIYTRYIIRPFTSTRVLWGTQRMEMATRTSTSMPLISAGARGQHRCAPD